MGSAIDRHNIPPTYTTHSSVEIVCTNALSSPAYYCPLRHHCLPSENQSSSVLWLRPRVDKYSVGREAHAGAMSSRHPSYPCVIVLCPTSTSVGGNIRACECQALILCSTPPWLRPTIRTLSHTKKTIRTLSFPANAGSTAHSASQLHCIWAVKYSLRPIEFVVGKPCPPHNPASRATILTGRRE